MSWLPNGNVNVYRVAMAGCLVVFFPLDLSYRQSGEVEITRFHSWDLCSLI